MSRFEWSLIWWLGGWIGIGFLVPEFAGFYGAAPWNTLSETVWHAEAEWPPTVAIVEAFLVVLLAHLIWRLSVAALAAVVVCAAVAVGVHFLLGTP